MLNQKATLNFFIVSFKPKKFIGEKRSMTNKAKKRTKLKLNLKILTRKNTQIYLFTLILD